ncbi:hypothetical protein MCOR25_009757 [Pyricularia grisea]|nr:hypothetical protein MCOR25_009757 [Pyricularia grisea]
MPTTSRPLLLPQNRRLRHLRGVYLRNLSFSKPNGRTIDDAAINKSPAKLDLVREAGQLHHAHSTEGLKSNSTPAVTGAVGASSPRLRRRSTGLTNANPVTRQKQLEYAVDSRLADVFFSLHCDATTEPIYISEVGERASNFNFELFELTDLSPAVTRSSHLTVKVWAKRQQSWTFLLEDDVDLRALSFVGTTLQNLHMPSNCLIFHLVDGIYIYGISIETAPPKQVPALATSSYNALMKLCTLENSVQDALVAQEELSARIDQALSQMPDAPVAEEEDKLQLARRYLKKQETAVIAAKKRREELRQSIQARKEAIKMGRELQDQARRDVENATDHLEASQDILAQTKESIHGQRRRICEDLIKIFPITEAPSGQPLSFQICGVPLPNTIYDPTLRSGAKGGAAAAEDMISAGLGYVAQLTHALQSYLGVALPYPITPFASRSSIRDDISMLPDPSRDFPLYVPRGGSSAQYRFDYGWFLLNKDIEVLCTAQGIRVVDIRHTLPNLKYLLYVCSAGKNELPERKKGGIRGLWHGQGLLSRGGVASSIDLSDPGGDGSVAGSSRRGSTDSEVTARHRDELTKSMADGTDIRPPSQRSSGGGMGFSESPEPTLLLRTKGLRGETVK